MEIVGDKPYESPQAQKVGYKRNKRFRLSIAQGIRCYLCGSYRIPEVLS